VDKVVEGRDHAGDVDGGAGLMVLLRQHRP
jgi:hypothetical protein